MRPTDLLLFLFGHRGSIERAAAGRHVLVVAALLVLSAGIARNYDHLDLLREPEWVIGPFAASLVTTGFIFACIHRPMRLGAVGGTWRQFRVFLCLVWLTAPCAWLYALPVESFTDLVTATKWNIAFLAIVSLWRVAIMTRCVAVLCEVRWYRALPLILAPAAFEAMLGSWFKGISLIGIMGGVRLPPHSELLRDAAAFTTTASLVVFVCALAACFVTKGVASRPLDRPAGSFEKGALIAAVAVLIGGWVAVIPVQRKVEARRTLIKLIQEKDYGTAAAYVGGKKREDFPVAYPLPPESGAWFPYQLLNAMTPVTPAWVREKWIRAASESLTTGYFRPEDVAIVEVHNSAIRQELRRHAGALERRRDLDRFDEVWLRNYRQFEEK